MLISTTKKIGRRTEVLKTRVAMVQQEASGGPEKGTSDSTKIKGKGDRRHGLRARAVK